MTVPEARSLEAVDEASRAELLLHPLRQRILSEACEASTAAEIARRVGLPPQKVNYHVRTLADAGFLHPAGEGLKRNLVEKRYRASARAYVLLPEVLGVMSPGASTESDRFSATHLMHLSARLQQEIAAWLEPDAGGAERVPTLSLEVELRFDSPEQRGAFADALSKAVGDVVAKHSAPAHDPEGQPRPGRPYRLIAGCYPVPDSREERGPDTSEGDTP